MKENRLNTHIPHLMTNIKQPSGMIVTEMLSLADLVFRQPPENVPLRITNEMYPSDSSFLKEIKQTLLPLPLNCGFI